MRLIHLKGKNDEYVFSPDKPESIIRAVGESSSVYIGVRVSNNQKVIIKHLNPSLRDNSTALKRFSQEAINLDHRGIVQSLEFLKVEDDYFIVREYIDGKDLKSLLKEKGPTSNKELWLNFCLESGIQVLDVISLLHQNNIIHCDIKPANIMALYQNERKEIDFSAPHFKIIDLGLSRNIQINEKMINGTIPFALVYSPPEQVLNQGELINQTSDLYALGITLYELITGRMPYKHSHPALLTNLQMVTDIKPDKQIPDGLFQILLKATHRFKFPLPPNRYDKSEVVKMLQIGQQGRYQSASEFSEALISFRYSMQKKIKAKKRWFGW
jgi:serine/threonine protein kinase